MSLWPFSRRKPFHRFEDGGGGPSKHHLPAAPPFHIALHLPRAADQALDRAGGGQQLAEAIGHAERQDGERLLEAFPDTRGGAGIAVLESARQILQRAAAAATSVCR
jgi:hypothetical protein